jgi:hypothetical protein
MISRERGSPNYPELNLELFWKHAGEAKRTGLLGRGVVPLPFPKCPAPDAPWRSRVPPEYVPHVHRCPLMQGICRDGYEEVLDFEALLAPVSEAAPDGRTLAPTGRDGRPDYDRVKSAAQEARTRERALANWHPSGDDEGEERPPAPDWRSVQQDARQILTKNPRTSG